MPQRRARDGRPSKPVTVTPRTAATFELDHGAVVIAVDHLAAPTPPTRRSCSAPRCWPRTPSSKGLTVKPWVKTSLAPGSKVVTDYYEQAGLTPYLEKLGFHLVGYGCTTCIGNSGPLPEEISAGGQRARPRRRLGAVRQPQLRGPDQPRRQDELPGLAAAGGRVRAGRHDGLRLRRPSRSGQDTDGNDVFLRDIWPAAARDRARRSTRAIDKEMFTKRLRRRVRRRRALAVAADARPATPSTGTPTRPTCASPRTSRAWPREPSPVTDIAGARVLAKLGDSVTTDHISPGRLDQGRQPRPASTWPSTASSARTSTPTARAAATTR